MKIGTALFGISVIAAVTLLVMTGHSDVLVIPGLLAFMIFVMCLIG